MWPQALMRKPEIMRSLFYPIIAGYNTRLIHFLTQEADEGGTIAAGTDLAVIRLTSNSP